MGLKAFSLFAIVMLTAIIFSGCCCCIPPGPDGGTPTPIGTPFVPTGQAVWTYVIYLDGDNNLEEAAIADFLEMEKAGSNQDVNVIVQLDRGGQYSGEGGWTGARRYLIQRGSGDAIVSPAAQDLGDTDSSSPETVSDFFSWAVDNYPAQKYAFVLWNHGGGWTGLMSDDTSSSRMHNTELKQVLESANAKLGRKLDIVIFDMCLMGQYEVALDIQPYADYMVASEETVPGRSFDYTALINALKSNPEMSSRELAAMEVNKFQEFYSGQDEATTMSALDLSKIPALKGAMDGFAGALTAHVNSGKWKDVADMHMYAESYPLGVDPEEARQYSFGDLYDFASNAESYSQGDAALGQTAQALQSAVDDAVVANYNHAKHPRSRGISYYFQPSKEIYDQVLPDVYQQTAAYNEQPWKSFLAAYYSRAPTSVDPPRIMDFAASKNASLARPLKFQYLMSGQNIVSNRWAQFYPEDGQWKLARLINQRTRTTLADGKEVYGFPGGTGEAAGSSSASEMFLSDGAQSIRAAVQQLWPVENFYAINGVLNKGNRQMDARLYFFDSNGSLARIQVFSSDSPPSISYLLGLGDGDRFTPYEYTLTQSGLNQQASGKTLAYDSQHGFSVSWQPLQPGDYMVADILTDMHNQTTYSSANIHIGTQPSFTPLQDADLTKAWECGQIEQGMRVQRLMVLDLTSGCRFEDVAGNATCALTYDPTTAHLFINVPTRFETYKFFASRENSSAFWLFSSTAGEDPIYCAASGSGRPTIGVYRDLYSSVGDPGNDLDEQRTDAACVQGEWESPSASMRVHATGSELELTIGNYTISGTYTIEGSALSVSIMGGQTMSFYYLCSDRKFVLYDMADSPAMVFNRPGHPLPAAPNDPVVAAGQQPTPHAVVPAELIGTWVSPYSGVLLFMSETGFFTLTDGNYYYYGQFSVSDHTLTLSTSEQTLTYTYEISEGMLTLIGNGETIYLAKVS